MKNTIPIDWRNANGTERYLVYCWIFCCPASPCSVSSSSFGTTEPRSCMMMDALMKGANPTAIKANWSNDPHNSMIKYPIPESPVLMVLDISILISTNGTGINTKSL
ncbi:MAG: hypothetical protein ACD_80C00070G0003 [uncultured bacterium (gcode 4)]|uniref:Uncharacterized protein n=1 Tax=uncultured bacterium (gcode 4) TaxID=1234023 RepID=K1XJK7_9BACT|nr:MAG: hypothetical protein ACD_80C00070G0003 [uncultured bacterium (gcode 4)]